MTAALLDRATTSTNGCRFPDWCNGSDESTSHVGGERNHWSSCAKQFWAYDVYERIGVQLYGYENDRDGVNLVRVYLAIGDEQFDEDGLSLPAEAARTLGVALRDFSPKRPTYDDALIHTTSADRDERVVTAEFRHERWRRHTDTTQPEHVEFSVLPDSSRKHCIRVRLSLKATQALGRCLVEEADRADASNAKVGLGS